MGSDISHRNAEYNAKAHLRNQYQSHRTSIDNYEMPEGVEYDQEVYKLAHNVSTYLIRYKTVDAFRCYINTTSIDWQEQTDISN